MRPDFWHFLTFLWLFTTWEPLKNSLESKNREGKGRRGEGGAQKVLTFLDFFLGKLNTLWLHICGERTEESCVAGCPVSTGVYPSYSSTWRPPTSPPTFTVGSLPQSRHLHQAQPAEHNNLFPSSGGSCYPGSWRYWADQSAVLNIHPLVRQLLMYQKYNFMLR